MATQDASVDELVGKIERGELRLPEMQRRYVWRSTRVRDLLDSLYRGYPSGAILVWETEEEVPLREFAVEQGRSALARTQLLLDGQQRLTSLHAVIRGKPVAVGERQKPIELLFNLEHPDALTDVLEVADDAPDDDDAADVGDDEADASVDELQKRFARMTFVVATKQLEQHPHWVKVTDVFKSDDVMPFLERAGIREFRDPRGEKYRKRLNRLRAIREYRYRVDVLSRDLSYEEVTEIFVRVNSLGAKLRSSDLALAQITAKWRGSLKTFQDFQQTCASDHGFSLDLGLHLKNLVAFATGQSRFRTIGGVTRPRLEEAWAQCVPGMQYALNFVQANAGIESPALLSSPFLLVAVAAFGHKRDYQVDSAESARLRGWLLLANAKGRYSRGSTETLLDQDLLTIRDGGGASELLDRLRTQVGRLEVEPDELEGRNQRSALFKTMYLAFKAAGARDWESNLAIALTHSGSEHKLQGHHIHPKALLKKASYVQRAIDDIANLAFIGGGSNRHISDRAPSEYFAAVLAKAGPQAFHAQCIPTDPALLSTAAYRDFLAERRRLIAVRLNEFLRLPG